MKTLKKAISILLVTLLILALTVGCQPGDNTTPTNKISTLEEEKGKTLSILIPGHNENDESLWQNQVVKEFREKYPDVKVEFITAGFDFTLKRLEYYQNFKSGKRAKALADENKKFYQEFFRKYPYAVNIPSLALNAYYSYWRYCK